ncbi:unnamed protein product [Rhizophagus irregularis]|nr:unnamed protein product [Rhizophagus irregularis]CAB5386027.1 unnamed protein product [Rhizophagus irregularis]
MVLLYSSKKDEFDKKAYNLLTANCQQATKKSISQNSAYSDKNDPNPKVWTTSQTQASTSRTRASTSQTQTSTSQTRTPTSQTRASTSRQKRK